MKSTYKIYEKDGIYFITSSIIEFIPVFTERDYFDIIIDCFKYCQKEKELYIFAYVIMENHWHAIVSSPELPKVMKEMKSYTAKLLIKKINESNKKWLINQLKFWKKKFKHDSKFQIWQEGYHPQFIKDEDMFYQKMNYIHMNPVNRGLVNKPEDWRYSSASNYAKIDSVLNIDCI